LSPLKGELALTSKFGVNLRNRPDDEGTNMGLVKAFATVRITGSGEREYTPVSIREQDVINIVDPLPQSTLPISRFEQEQAVIEPVTEESSIPGWVFTNELELLGGTARVSAFGSSLRAEPRRDASKVGFITPGNLVVLTGTEQGEYLPVRVWEKELQPVLPESDDTGADAIVLGNARIGLHASLDLVITGKEQRLFETLRPGIIKVFSTHGSEDIKRLAKAHSKAQWIVRAKAPFGSRLVSPGQFYGETVDDVRRILKMLPERSVVIELHSKPNTALEGLESSWSDGKAFEQWWLELLDRYRQELPDARFLYPGLAVGGGVTGVKEDHIRFLEASRKAVEEADGMGLHLYWSEYTSPNQVLAILDDTITRFRDKPLWITEAGRVGEVLSTEIAAGEYLNLWAELQVRPAVRGVVYFTTPAENGEIGQQVLIGEELVKVIGRR
ncbi:MAG: hypothetical protein ACK2T3_01140, partial [Candidatus Promineifilaceae bacterium]